MKKFAEEAGRRSSLKMLLQLVPCSDRAVCAFPTGSLLALAECDSQSPHTLPRADDNWKK